MPENNAELAVPGSPMEMAEVKPPVAPRQSNIATALLLNSMTVLLMVMIFWVPKLEKMFDDFGTQLPFQTKMLMNLSRWIGGRLTVDQGIPGWFWLQTAMAIVIGLIIARKVANRRSVADSNPSRVSLGLLIGVLFLPIILIPLGTELVRLPFLGGLFEIIFALSILFYPTEVWLILLGLSKAQWIDSPNLVGANARLWIWGGILLVTFVGVWAIISPMLKLLATIQ